LAIDELYQDSETPPFKSTSEKFAVSRGLPAEALKHQEWSTVAASSSNAAIVDSLHENRERRLMSRIFLTWNQLERWLPQVDVLRLAS
jgi:hypothetical protein